MAVPFIHPRIMVQWLMFDVYIITAFVSVKLSFFLTFTQKLVKLIIPKLLRCIKNWDCLHVLTRLQVWQPLQWNL